MVPSAVFGGELGKNGDNVAIWLSNKRFVSGTAQGQIIESQADRISLNEAGGASSLFTTAASHHHHANERHHTMNVHKHLGHLAEQIRARNVEQTESGIHRPRSHG